MYKRFVAVSAMAAIGLVLSNISGCASEASIKNAAALTFDGLIDQSPGENASQAPNDGAYRTRKVDFSILRRVDLQGYYFQLRDQFKAWCSANRGSMQTDTETSMYGQVCVGGAQAVIAAFEVETVVLKQYQGDMTAGYSLIRFYDARTWEKLSTARMNQVINKELAATRRAVCIEQERQAFRANLKPGDFAANGLIVETKPPLALVQGSDVAHSQWLPIANLLPRSTACGRVGP